MVTRTARSSWAAPTIEIHPTPYKLPIQKTRSGIRTQSSPHATGFNELSFEDAVDQEMVFMHAQKDFQLKVLNDYTQSVSGQSTVSIAKGQKQEIGGERHDVINGGESRLIGGMQTSRIAGDQTTTVVGKQEETITGGAIHKVHGYSLSNDASHVESITGYSTVTVGTESTPTALSYMVYGSENHDATKDITIRSETNIRFVVGDTMMVLSTDGIRIKTKKLVAKATDSITMFGNGPVLELDKEATVIGDAVRVYSKGASLEMDDQTITAGAKSGMDLACDPKQKQITDTDPTAPTKPFKWTMIDGQLQPLKNKNYTLVAQGFKTNGTTDGSGVISTSIPFEAQTAKITIWTDTYPTGPRVNYSIQLGELPPPSGNYGALLRLKNLGYYSGPEGDAMTPSLAAAIASFQHDQNIPATGKLDGPTIGKLSALHP